MASFQILPSAIGMVFVLGLISASSIRFKMTKKTGKSCSLLKPPLDSIPRTTNNVIIGGMMGADNPAAFKYQWLAIDGTVHSDKASGRLEIAATPAITAKEIDVAISIVSKLIRNMPPEVFKNLADGASVGIFTLKDKTTIFPEYCQHKDRPECAGICSGACAETCTSDGRKYDTLAGVGGKRTTCLNDNFMCTAKDPYLKKYSVLVHEFAHTVHLHGLKNGTEYYEKISKAYNNAKISKIWDLNSYAMSDEQEYFAQSAGVFFNTDRDEECNHSGGMNRCGNPSGKGICKNEKEARDWLKKKDILLFEVLSYTFTNNRPAISGELGPCVSLSEAFLPVA